MTPNKTVAAPQATSPHPTFHSLNISPKILAVLDRLKFVIPTPIQAHTIPVALEGKDIIGIAQTGTGKTLAFGIPMLQYFMTSKKRGLILVPTRELAIQVDETFRKVGQPIGINTAVLIGGASMIEQLKMLRQDPRVIIATPGRLLDHLNQKKLTLNDVSIVVLDEADRMLDMGFAPDITKLLSMVSKDRQTMLFSATIPQEILKISAQHMRLPIHIEVAPTGTAASGVTQELFIVRQEMKKSLLTSILAQYKGQVLVFSRTKIGAKKICRVLRDGNHKAVEIHSDRSLSQRKEALEGFKKGRYRILVATDIAARGIDVKGIELVINYDVPDESENYIHRIGRTGRAGQQGHAITLATPDQGDTIQKIEKLMRTTLPVGNHPEFPSEKFSFARGGGFVGGRRSGGGGGGSRSRSPFRSRGGSSSSSGSSRPGFRRR